METSQTSASSHCDLGTNNSVWASFIHQLKSWSQNWCIQEWNRKLIILKFKSRERKFPLPQNKVFLLKNHWEQNKKKSSWWSWSDMQRWRWAYGRFYRRMKHWWLFLNSTNVHYQKSLLRLNVNLSKSIYHHCETPENKHTFTVFYNNFMSYHVPGNVLYLSSEIL